MASKQRGFCHIGIHIYLGRIQAWVSFGGGKRPGYLFTSSLLGQVDASMANLVETD